MWLLLVLITVQSFFLSNPYIRTIRFFCLVFLTIVFFYLPDEAFYHYQGTGFEHIDKQLFYRLAFMISLVFSVKELGIIISQKATDKNFKKCSIWISLILIIACFLYILINFAKYKLGTLWKPVARNSDRARNVRGSTSSLKLEIFPRPLYGLRKVGGLGHAATIRSRQSKRGSF